MIEIPGPYSVGENRMGPIGELDRQRDVAGAGGAYKIAGKTAVLKVPNPIPVGHGDVEIFGLGVVDGQGVSLSG